MVKNVLFLACVLARGGEREGASQWWNVQGPHSPSRTLSVSKLRIYNCPVQLHCMQMISLYVNTSCMSNGMTKRYRSRVDGFQSIACPMYPICIDFLAYSFYASKVNEFCINIHTVLYLYTIRIETAKK